MSNNKEFSEQSNCCRLRSGVIIDILAANVITGNQMNIDSELPGLLIGISAKAVHKGEIRREISMEIIVMIVELLMEVGRV